MNTYYFKFKKSFSFSSISTYAFGINSNIKSLDDIEDYIIKAKSNGCKYFKIPFDNENFNLLREIRTRLEEHDLELVALVDLNNSLEAITKTDFLGIKYEFILDRKLERNLDEIQADLTHLNKKYIEYKITITVHRSLELSLFKKLIDLNFENVYYYFSVNYNENFNFLNPHEISSFLNNLKRKISSSPWQILWDHRISDDLELIPLYEPTHVSTLTESTIFVSVIIPSFNNANYLIQTLKNLFNSTYEKKFFEIILVDDGSSDDTQPLVKKLFDKYKDQLNLKLIYIPRFKQRIMGDANYRAGIARNCALKHAQGGFLFFLDSDILVCKDYIIESLNILKDCEIVQSTRFDLTEEASHLNLDYADIQDFHVSSRDQYWFDFNKNIHDWNEAKDKWKYLCTHSLCIRKTDFMKYGGFKYNFIFYGFEDTDLGYHLKNLNFKLNKTPVYHLYHEYSRSEFFNSPSVRNLLLSKTAQIFFILNLDITIYSKFKSLMFPEFSLKNFLKKIILRIKLRCLKSWPVLKA